MTEDVLQSVKNRVQEALLGQARQDLIADAYEACRGKLDLLLKDVTGDAAVEPLCVRLLLMLAYGAIGDASNVAFYLEGAVTKAVRSAEMGDALGMLAEWPRLPELVRMTGFTDAVVSAEPLLAHLAARAFPIEDPAWMREPARTDREPPLVVVTLMNGMGDQIFQYAAALRRARRSGGTVKFDLSIFSSQRFGTRPFALDAFAIDVSIASPDDMDRVQSHQLVDPLNRVDVELLTGDGDCRLLGSWPSPLYFRGVEAELRATLRFRDPAIGARATATVDDLRRRGPVIGMHVRRGDLLSPVYRNAYGPLPVEYFRTALRGFPDDGTVVVFSDGPDDRAWCAEAFAELGDRLVISHDRSDVEDFAFLAACDHQIVSVSSFSWWAAWLNPNPDKRVVTPHPAFGSGPRRANIQLAGRVPPEWLVVTRDDVR